jgi:NADH-quinone oxidoreductase subunit J
LAAVGVVAFDNAVRSALCLVVNFFMLAFLYFTLNAELLGITQIIVYTGAIMVLFLFVIMLLNLGAPQALYEKTDYKRFGGLILGAALFAMVLSQVVMPLQEVTKLVAPDNYGSPQNVGRTLFTTYVWPFEVASILLLIGIVGSILLAKRRI